MFKYLAIWQFMEPFLSSGSMTLTKQDSHRWLVYFLKNEKTWRWILVLFLTVQVMGRMQNGCFLSSFYRTRRGKQMGNFGELLRIRKASALCKSLGKQFRFSSTPPDFILQIFLKWKITRLETGMQRGCFYLQECLWAHLSSVGILLKSKYSRQL